MTVGCLGQLLVDHLLQDVVYDVALFDQNSRILCGLHLLCGLALEEALEGFSDCEIGQTSLILFHLCSCFVVMV